MTWLLSIDPGKNSGIALGYFDSLTPYQLHQRWQVHGGVVGLAHWWRDERPEYDVLVIEKFILDPTNEFTADLSAPECEGFLLVALEGEAVQPVWQLRSAKGDLTGYPKWATKKHQRQRIRFNFLERFGLFRAGTENDDSNDAITHGVVWLKRMEHLPQLRQMWPPREPKFLLFNSDISPDLREPTF